MINENEIVNISKKWDSLSSNNWNPTAILFITTHGIVTKEDETSDIHTFTVPQGITIKRATASTPGECNIVEPEVIDGYVSLIKSLMSELLSNREDTQNNAISKVFTTVQKIESNELTKKRKYIEIAGDNEDYVEDYKRFVKNFNKAFGYKEFHSGEQIIDKKYVRSNNQATKNDWTMKVMNIPGNPDLLSFLKSQTRFGESTVTLKEIVEFLQGKGVSTIVIFDMTCSSIMTTNFVEYPERHVRRLRRDIKDRQIGGYTKFKTSFKTRKKRSNQRKRIKFSLSKRKRTNKSKIKSRRF